MTPDYITFSNIIIDDIVLWDGRTMMGVLGGAGTHALIGMRVWSESLGYVATVGPDFAPEQRAQLEKLGIDLRGVYEHPDYTTTRAWQIFEQDERRTEVMRTDPADFAHFKPNFQQMPADYRQAKGVHFQWGNTFDELEEMLGFWRTANPDVVLVWEPILEQLNGTAQEFESAFQQMDLLSPDIDQARAMTGKDDPLAMAQELIQWGAPNVAIRMGAAGSIICTAAGDHWQIPAVPPSALVDVTGAGNAYCGGFTVARGEGHSVLEAALRAAVSASFAIEQFGVPDFDDQIVEEAQRRLSWARERTMDNG